MSNVCNVDQIYAWARAHKHDLPRTLAELAEYPMAFRRVIIGVVPSTLRIEFWQAHLESFLTDGSPLTSDQQQFVREALVALPAIFGAELEEAQRLAREQEQRMSALFPRETAHLVFGILGPPEPVDGLQLPASFQ